MTAGRPGHSGGAVGGAARGAVGSVTTGPAGAEAQWRGGPTGRRP